jgi:hypothetical protein
MEAVPIAIEATPAFNDAYRVVLPSGESVANVVVSGSAQQINLIRNHQFAVQARLPLEKSDYGQEAPKPLIFDLPDGVKVQGPPRTVDFKIAKRETPGG